MNPGAQGPTLTETGLAYIIIFLPLQPLLNLPSEISPFAILSAEVPKACKAHEHTYAVLLIHAVDHFNVSSHSFSSCTEDRRSLYDDMMVNDFIVHD